ncbi:MAG: restriction endonuclease [Acidobacteria bacterium]|nr:restriction endonuclease [Acidobacteriota bacterium]
MSESIKKDRTRNDKGILLEEVVAMLHDYEGVKVERNVKLPPKSGDKSRKIEIDVLLTSYVAGYSIQIAIQCKNYGKRITREQIGAFKDSLDDAGIPYQHGIIVSVHGYQSGATKRAKELGIKTLELKGLTKDRLAIEIEKAYQFFVYFLATVIEISIQNDLQSINSPYIDFNDENRKYCGDINDLIVSRWRQGEIPLVIGEYEIQLKIPEGWYHFRQDRIVKIFSISARVKVTGRVLELIGNLQTLSLVESETQKSEKFKISAEFNSLEEMKKLNEKVLSGFQGKIAETETELEDILNQSLIKVIHRIRLPRIISGSCFMPMSERVAGIIEKEVRGLSLEEIGKLPQKSILEYEGEAGSIHEKPLFGFPVIVNDSDENYLDRRLLFKRGEYNKILRYKHLFNKYSTPEFAELLKLTNKEIGKQILGLN